MESEDILQLLEEAALEAGRGHRVPVEVERQWDVPSDSRPGVFYTLKLLADGELRCSCPGYEHRAECKHIRRMRAELKPDGTSSGTVAGS